MIRQDIFTHKVTFSRAFDHNSQLESVPRSLLSLVSMVINGSNITDQTNNTNISQPVLSIAQLLVHNCIKRRKECVKIPQVYHSKDREKPLPVYVGLKAHAVTRERQLIDSLFALGMSASYNCTMEWTWSHHWEITSFCDCYHQTGTVCPPNFVRVTSSWVLQTTLIITLALQVHFMALASPYSRSYSARCHWWRGQCCYVIFNASAPEMFTIWPRIIVPSLMLLSITQQFWHFSTQHLYWHCVHVWLLSCLNLKIL